MSDQNSSPPEVPENRPIPARFIQTDPFIQLEPDEVLQPETIEEIRERVLGKGKK